MMKDNYSTFCYSSIGYSEGLKAQAEEGGSPSEKIRIEDTSVEELFYSGKWTIEEHTNFILGVVQYGNDWKEIQKLIVTRSCAQARSHSQKFFIKLKKMKDNAGFGKEICSVKNLHEHAKGIDCDRLKSLIQRLIEIYASSDNCIVPPLSETTIQKIDQMRKTTSEWNFTKTNSISEVCTILDDYPSINSFAKFCDETIWKFESFDSSIFPNLPYCNTGKPGLLCKRTNKNCNKKKRNRFTRIRKPKFIYKPKLKLTKISPSFDLESTSLGRKPSVHFSNFNTQDEEGTLTEDKEEENIFPHFNQEMNEVGKELFNYENETVLRYLGRE